MVVWRKCPQRPVAHAYAIFNFCLAFYSFYYFLWQLSGDPDKALWLHQLLFLGVIWIQQALLYFVFQFLDMAHERKGILWTAFAFNLLFSYLNFSGGLYTAVEPRFGLGFWPVPTPWAVVYIAFWHLQCFYCFGLLIHAGIRSYKEGQIPYLQQVKYMVLAFNIGYFGGATNWPVWFQWPIPPYLNSLITVYVALIAYAIVKHRLMDMQIIIKKTLTYSIVTVSLTVVYWGVLTLCLQGLDGWLDQRYSTGVAAVIVVLLFQPVRVRVQKFIDQKFYRYSINVRASLDQLTHRLIEKASPVELSETIFSVLDEMFHPKTMALYLRSSEGYGFIRFSPDGNTPLPNRLPLQNVWSRLLVADSPSPTPLASVLSEWNLACAFPMRDAGMLVGFLLLGEKKSEESYNEKDASIIRMALQEAEYVYLETLRGPAIVPQPRAELLKSVASGIVHEIKSPLANINLPAQIIFADLLALEQGKRKLEDFLPKLKQRLKYISAQAGKASNRIDAINEFATVQNQHFEHVSLSSVLRESLDMLEPLIASSGVTVHFDPPAESLTVLGNGDQLDMVFSNLIKNAAEAMAIGISEPSQRHLWIRLSASNSKIVVEVQDSGPGIKPEHRSRVFEHHFTTKGVSGTGVGLYLIRQLVHAHEGAIDFSTEENKGTTFTVSLPKPA